MGILVGIAAVSAPAQVAVGVGIGPSYGYVSGPPVCTYGYYDYYPYATETATTDAASTAGTEIGIVGVTGTVGADSTAASEAAIGEATDSEATADSMVVAGSTAAAAFMVEVVTGATNQRRG